MADRFTFEIRLHSRPAAATAGSPLGRHDGSLPTLAVPADRQADTMAVSFDTALEKLATLPGCYTEPDGAILWTGTDAQGRWQIDGNLYDRGGRVVFAALAGSCPVAALDQLLGCFGWPHEPLMMELVREAVFVSEEVFRGHAARP